MAADLSAFVARTGADLEHHNTIRFGATVWLGVQPILEDSHGTGAAIEIECSDGRSWEIALDDAVTKGDELLHVPVHDVRAGLTYNVWLRPSSESERVALFENCELHPLVVGGDLPETPALSIEALWMEDEDAPEDAFDRVEPVDDDDARMAEFLALGAPAVRA